LSSGRDSDLGALCPNTDAVALGPRLRSAHRAARLMAQPAAAAVTSSSLANRQMVQATGNGLKTARFPGFVSGL
jgi:hypothetical protein